MKTSLQHNFAIIPDPEIPRSSFDRSHRHLTTIDVDYIYPIFCDEALPGDTFNVNMTGFARLNTPIFPIMDNMYMDVHFFSVPCRLLWDHWENFMGEQTGTAPIDPTDYEIPTKVLSAVTNYEGLLHDYFGLPIDVGTDKNYNALPLRAYTLIWNEWYRDQNLQTPASLSTADGPDSTLYELKKRGKRHDYFTSCLPWPQKGDDVVLPLGTSATVAYQSGLGTHGYVRKAADDALATASSDIVVDAGGTGRFAAPSGTLAYYDPNGTLYADLSTATAATINSLREAFQIQKLLERDARGGSRYIEIVRSHFGVVSPDLRATRPEFLGGGTTMVNVTPIAQTSSTDATTPQGNLAAMGTANLRGIGFNKSFTEHCYVIGLVSVRADLTYQQGLHKMWSRSSRYDFYWPAFANLGEQAVLKQEIYADGSATDDDVFGYQERYAEYRYKPNQISGKMRSNATGTLDAWHLAEDFASVPSLNSTFIASTTPIDRCVAVTTEPDFLLDTYFSMRCVRPMPVYAVPGLIDHF